MKAERGILRFSVNISGGKQKRGIRKGKVMMRVRGDKVISNKCKWKVEDQLTAFSTEFGKFLKDIPGGIPMVSRE